MMRAPNDRMMRAGNYLTKAAAEPRPGTLTLRYGNEVVVLDPSSPPARFRADKARMEALFDRMGRDFNIRLRD